MRHIRLEQAELFEQEQIDDMRPDTDALKKNLARFMDFRSEPNPYLINERIELSIKNFINGIDFNAPDRDKPNGHISILEKTDLRNWLLKLNTVASHLEDRKLSQLANEMNIPGNTELLSEKQISKMQTVELHNKKQQTKEHNLTNAYEYAKEVDGDDAQFAGVILAWWKEEAEKEQITNIAEFYDTYLKVELIEDETTLQEQELKIAQTLSDEPGSFLPYGAVLDSALEVGKSTFNGLSERQAFLNACVQMKNLREQKTIQLRKERLETLNKAISNFTSPFNWRDTHLVESKRRHLVNMYDLSVKLGIEPPEWLGFLGEKSTRQQYLEAPFPKHQPMFYNEEEEEKIPVVEGQDSAFDEQELRRINRDVKFFDLVDLDKLYKRYDYDDNEYEEDDEEDDEEEDDEEEDSEDPIVYESFLTMEEYKKYKNELLQRPNVFELSEDSLETSDGKIVIENSSKYFNPNENPTVNITFPDGSKISYPRSQYERMKGMPQGLSHCVNKYRITEALQKGAIVTSEDKSAEVDEFIPDTLGLRERFLGYRNSTYLREGQLYSSGDNNRAAILFFSPEFAYQKGTMMTPCDAIDRGDDLRGSIDSYAIPTSIAGRDFRRELLEQNKGGFIDYMHPGQLNLADAEAILWETSLRVMTRQRAEALLEQAKTSLSDTPIYLTAYDSKVDASEFYFRLHLLRLWKEGQLPKPTPDPVDKPGQPLNDGDVSF